MTHFRWRLTGLLGTNADRKKDFFFGIISDGIHCHPATVRCLPHSIPTAIRQPMSYACRRIGVRMNLIPYYSVHVCMIVQVKLAYSAHPEGCILVTDAMPAMGLEPGTGS